MTTRLVYGEVTIAILEHHLTDFLIDDNQSIYLIPKLHHLLCLYLIDRELT